MATSMTCNQILRDLKYCDNKFPEAAIQAARQNRDEMIPGLMAEITDATKVSEEGEAVATWGHIAALFLLFEFNAKQAFPEILRSMCIEEAEGLYGDYITEDLQHIAARLSNGPEQLAAAINDSNVNEYVRGAFVDAVFGMVCEKRITREAAIQFLRDRLKTAIADEDLHVATKTVEVLGLLGAEAARKEVKAAEQAELVDETWIGLDFFEEQLARGQTAFDEARDLYLAYNANLSADILRSIPWFNQEPPVSQTLESVLQDIREPFSQLPVEAIRWARTHREEITPHLIQIIEGVPEYAELRANDSEEPETAAHIIALYLLTEFGSREVLPALLNILTDPDEDVVDGFQDVLDQDMAQILGRLADEPYQITPLIINPDVNDGVRRDAVESIVWMVTEGKLDRNAAIALLLDWLQESRKNDDSILSTWIALSLMDLGASHACQTLVEASDAGEMEEMWICTEEIEEALADGEASFLETIDNHRFNRIEHTVVELAGWNWDESQVDDEDSDDEWSDDDDEDQIDFADDDDVKQLWRSLRERYTPEQLLEITQLNLPELLDDSADHRYTHRPDVTPPIRLDSPKVGRNDPCPCGSGKKFKKCCAKADA